MIFYSDSCTPTDARSEAERKEKYLPDKDPLICGKPTCHARNLYVSSDKYGRIVNSSHSTKENFNYGQQEMENLLYKFRHISQGVWRYLINPASCKPCQTKVSKSKFRRKCTASKMLMFLSFLTCLGISEGRHSDRGGPPRLLEAAKTRVTATIGRPLTLKCDVSADPFPLTSWKFNGEQIGMGKRRFKQHSLNLRIRDVQKDDEGVYKCTATNGFGSVEYEIRVTVEAPNTAISTPSKPRFMFSAKMRKKIFVKRVGSFLRLRCRASGIPTPQIEWYKDGNLTVSSSPSSRQSRPAWIYTIRGLTTNDSGQYTCRVWNREGEISYTYTVKAVGNHHEKPILLEPHPMNTTVRVGGMTTIQCRVQSVAKPTIKWIKRLTKNSYSSYGESDGPQNIIRIEGKHYLILPEQEMLSLKDGSYLNKLVIRGATEHHAGMYICLGANTIGYNYRYAYLTVLPADPIIPHHSTSLPQRIPPRRPSSNRKTSLPLPVIIGIPSGVGLMMAILIAWYCQRKRERTLKQTNVVVSGSDRLSAVGSVETKSSTRSTPVPQDNDNPADFQPNENNNKGTKHADNPDRMPHMGRQDPYYSHRYRGPPTVGTPLLTVTEPDDTDFQINVRSDDESGVPIAPPPSEANQSRITSYYSDRNLYRYCPPSPPPPSKYSASTVSSYPEPQYPPHYHYMYPPHASTNSRRHHHHHHHGHQHHSKSSHGQYEY